MTWRATSASKPAGTTRPSVLLSAGIHRRAAALDVRGRPPLRRLAIIAKGDEVLDWREMVARYPRPRLRLLEGGDHALSDFTEHLEPITRFLQLA